MAWATCRGSAPGSTRVTARPATTISERLRSRIRALTDALPTSRPTARCLRKSVKFIVFPSTCRLISAVGTRSPGDQPGRRRKRLYQRDRQKQKVYLRVTRQTGADAPTAGGRRVRLGARGIAAAVLPRLGGQARVDRGPPGGQAGG